MELLSGQRGQEKKIEEMIENVNKLKEDVKDMKLAFEDIINGQKSIDELLKMINDKLEEK